MGSGPDLHRPAGAPVTIRALAPGDVEACREILDLLPDWFGIAEVNAGYVESLGHLPSFVAVDGDERVVGFLAIDRHTPTSAEITVMGVRPDLHRGGHGRALVEAAISFTRDGGARWLHAKTRGPSTYDDNYERTRRFWFAMGFETLYESRTEWGEDDAALIMVMALQSA